MAISDNAYVKKPAFSCAGVPARFWGRLGLFEIPFANRLFGSSVNRNSVVLICERPNDRLAMDDFFAAHTRTGEAVDLLWGFTGTVCLGMRTDPFAAHSDRVVLVGILSKSFGSRPKRVNSISKNIPIYSLSYRTLPACRPQRRILC